MSFNTALSGLNAAQSDLSVTSNNIANVSTTGFKQSRAEFGDIYANSTFGNSKTAIGAGVLLQAVTQQFTQGNLDFTSNTLDFAVSGEGFFVLSPNQTSSERVFTRAGAFGVNESGQVVNSSGQLLQVFPVNSDGSVAATSLSSTIPLRLPESAGTPQATSEVEMGINLPANASALTVADFDPTASNTYTASTSVNVFDSLGDTHIATTYFVKDDSTSNNWAMFLYVDGDPVDVNGGTADTTVPARWPAYADVTFDAVGAFTSTTPATIQSIELGDPALTTSGAGANIGTYTNGQDPNQTITIDLANNSPTQFASAFTVNSLSQDGFSIGRLSGLDVSDTGVVRATYTNGQTTPVGKIALARFANPQGLSQVSNTSWAATTDSGEPLAGEAGTSSFGLIQGGALELSNVDLTQELVGLITSQRNFQANAKSIETFNAITQTIIQIR
ncbi:MAG: flagellar hook protein FlgE [Pseudomonadales bacterium]|nr:flagellar hook protein FlgE [Pseudomonadales bacterium]